MVFCNDTACTNNEKEQCKLTDIHIDNGVCSNRLHEGAREVEAPKERRKMKGAEVLQSLFGRGKNSTVEASEKMGKSRGFIGSYVTKGNIPKLDTAAAILDAIDYDLVIRNRETGEEIIIEPNE